MTPGTLSDEQAHLLKLMRLGATGVSSAADSSTWTQMTLDKVDGTLIEPDLEHLRGLGLVEQIIDDGRTLWRATPAADWAVATHTWTWT